MTKKLIIITGSALIGLISMLAIIFTMIATGAIEVEQKTIVFSSASAETTYTGETLTAGEWKIISGQLREGHSARVIVSGQQTTVGSSLNTISATIVDENGADVTEYYKIEYQPGTLKVFHRSLQVLANSATKVYDGTPLDCHQYTIAAGELPAGHIIVPSYTDSITDVGTTANNVSVAVHDASGADVSANYNIMTISGSLTVTKRQIYFQSKSFEKVYDGTPLTNGDATYEILSGELVPGHVVNSVYSGSITNAGSTINSLEITIDDANGRSVTDNYNIIITNGTLTVTKRAVEYQSGSFEKTYDGSPMTFTQSAPNTATLINGSLVDGHYAVITMLKSIVDAGSVSNEFSIFIYDANNHDSSGNDVDVTANYGITYHFGTLTVSPVRLSISSGSAVKEFDGTPLTAYGVYYTGTETLIVSGVTEIFPGLKLFYGMTGTQTVGGSSNNTFTFYIADDNGKDHTKNFLVDVLYGTLTVTSNKVTFVSGSDSKDYDGTPLELHEYTSSNLPAGYTVHPAFTASITDAGSVDNKFTVIIRDASGNDVTGSFDIDYVYGKLTVNKRPYSISTPDLTKTYDGTPLTSEGTYTVIGGTSLAPGHYVSVTFTGSRTNAGTSKNSFIIRIYDELDNEVTKNYYTSDSISGSIIVTPIHLTVRSEDIVEFYTGATVSSNSDNCSLVSGELLAGHKISFLNFISSSDACSTTNYFTAVITDESGKSVTTNYELTYVYGSFKILPRVVKVITHSANHTYDGQPFSCHKYTVDPEDALLAGHYISYISFSPNSTITNVGTVKNVISSIVIKNALDEDVTRNYSFDFTDRGDVIVTPRPITIRSVDASKNYDGTPLVDGRWDVVSLTTPLENHLLEVAVSGTRTEVGEEDNLIAEVRITDTETNENVTSNYAITKQLGTLTVKGNGAGDSNPTPDDNEDAGAIDDGGGLGGDNSNDDTVCIRLYSETSGQVYLRHKSFGNFDPSAKKWGEAASYTELLDRKYSYNYLAGVALKNTGMDSIRIDVENLISAQYFIPYFPDMYDSNYDIQTSDVIYAGDSSNVYSLYYYPYAGTFVEIDPDLGEYSDGELEYREYVYDNYLYVDENLRDYMKKIIDANGFDATSSSIVTDVATYIQTAATYNLKYDRAIDNATHPIIAFLMEQEGVCRHYASAATALFRTLGMPARYVIGFSGQTKAGSWTEITGKQAHAWTEVYIDGIGWIPVEVTGSSNDGSGNGNGNGDGSGNGSEGEENAQAIKIRPQTTYHKYDGNVHYPSNYVDGLSALLDKGFTYVATVEKVGSATNLPGIYATKITSFTLYDSEGNDVTSEHKLEWATGYMQIYLREITVKTYSDSKVYDGTPLTNGEYTVNGELLSNHTIKILTCTGQQTNVGKSTNNFTISIVDENGVDVTDCYRVKRSCGTLTVTAKAITVTANSATKSYDGLALVDKGYTVEGELEGYTVEATISGSQTKIGYSDNLVEKVIVWDGLGRDVTRNFIIECINGKLYVTPPTN